MIKVRAVELVNKNNGKIKTELVYATSNASAYNMVVKNLKANGAYFPNGQVYDTGEEPNSVTISFVNFSNQVRALSLRLRNAVDAFCRPL